MANLFFAAQPSPSQQMQLIEISKTYFASSLSANIVQEGLTFEMTQDLHITLGYMKSVQIKDFEKIQTFFSSLKNIQPISGYLSQSVLFNNAWGFIIKPVERLAALHQSYHEKLVQNTQIQYGFDVNTSFIPHLTLARLNKKCVYFNQIAKLALTSPPPLLQAFPLDLTTFGLFYRENPLLPYKKLLIFPSTLE